MDPHQYQLDIEESSTHLDTEKLSLSSSKKNLLAFLGGSFKSTNRKDSTGGNELYAGNDSAAGGPEQHTPSKSGKGWLGSMMSKIKAGNSCPTKAPVVVGHPDWMGGNQCSPTRCGEIGLADISENTEPCAFVTSDPFDDGDRDCLALGELNSCMETLPLKETDRAQSWESGRLYSLIDERLSFSAHDSEAQTIEEIRRHPHRFYFSSDLHEQYFPFCEEFGPVSLASVVHFCRLMRKNLGDPRLKGRECIYYCSNDSDDISNTAFLLSAFLMIDLGFSPEDAVRPFESIRNSPIIPFRDASYLESTFPLTIADCLRGLKKAMSLGWFHLDTFSCEDFEDLADSEIGGDMSKICPKFVAMRGPEPRSGDIDQEDFVARAPEEYFAVLAALKVKRVVRLNTPTSYNANVFKGKGFGHTDLFFEERSCPADELVMRFLAVCEEQGVVAVHCVAGLGRTGTMIGVWLMSKCGLTAREAIAWMRIVRPGCVMGLQQHYLEWMEERLKDGSFPLARTPSGAIAPPPPPPPPPPRS